MAATPEMSPSMSVGARPALPPRESATLVATIIDLDCGVLVRIEGEASCVGLENLQVAFARVLARRPPLAVLDLSRLNFLSSLAMGLLVQLRRDLARWHGLMKIANCPPAVGEVLATAGLADFFEFHASVEEAISAA
jgi:anti-anti-sigma factor